MIKINLSKEHKQNVLNWIDDKTSKLTDLKPLWKELKSILHETTLKEFDGSNPNSWKPLNPLYVQEKTSEGYPATIGVRTGGLKWASTAGAVFTTKNKTIEWAVNTDYINSDGEKVGDYIGDFNEARKQFKYSGKYLRALIKDTVNDWIGRVIR